MSEEMTSPKEDTWSASAYNKTAAFVYSQEFTSPILTLLSAQSGEKIIDFGCGTGELTLQVQAQVGNAGEVVGVDSSANMIEKCKANGIVNAFVGDIQDLQLPAELSSDLRGGYDAVFSNAAIHWCKRSPRGVLESAKRVLKPGGRFVIEMGGHLNCVGLISALHEVLRSKGYEPEKLNPWYFPTPEAYKSLLVSTGFEVQHISLHPRRTPLSGTLVDWMRLFCRGTMFQSMGDEETEEIMCRVEDICRVDCMDEQGNWWLMYCRLRVVAVSRYM
ncbi:S-adenosyl-L-methionine-dependent methyltransferase [Obba rivulosa]|uniref:S-adenosyl-L-methionine-dependent methyltransferase n=1 Tax=Obba rivulosa TaxID=1052685 RepID=A0A8E2AVI9_9APHY|nr:S-adenosyl-L-methionine-dependent methyltransferase [Obba rivulosa]